MAKIIQKIEDLPEQFLTEKPQFYRGALRSILSHRASIDASELPNTIWVPTQDRPSRFDHFKEILVSLQDLIEEEEKEQEKEENFADLADKSESGRQQYFQALQQINDFNYANEISIREAFNGVFKESILINLIQEILVEDDPSARTKIRDIVGANAGSEEISKWVTEQVSTGASLEEMLSRLLEYLLEQRQVIVGLEVLDPKDIDAKHTEKLERELAAIQNRLKFTLQQDEVEQKRDELRRQSVHRIITKLSAEDLKGRQVLIYGKFKIERNDDNLVFRYRHPVSSLFGRRVSICTLGIPSSDLSPPKIFEKSIGSTMILRMYGEIFQPLNTTDKLCELTLRVIAIY